ncbi:hypothetical protein [Arthrobacter sp. M4]|uniref:hypothetical protein n=1 Tax=Arthrobacter sp. M4 TaxID=218160 RepID=UPI001CDCCDB8|nr:hypothetical protein [Arthrobacter sp. M4]MCA4135198.1 hypothetical protein [Arthrobacter sp. M4]
MADAVPSGLDGRTWLVRRAEGRLDPELGRLRFIASSRHIYWKALLPCLVAGFLLGTINEFVTPGRSAREPGLFQDLPLFLLISVLTGLVLWSLTLLRSFRKLLVFDGGLVTGFSQPQLTKIFRWSDVDATSVRAVTASSGPGPSRLLKASSMTPLGAGGRNALVFRSGAAFYVFESDVDPAPLVLALQSAMVDAGVAGAEGIASKALPPTPLTGATRLD